MKLSFSIFLPLFFFSASAKPVKPVLVHNYTDYPYELIIRRIGQENIIIEVEPRRDCLPGMVHFELPAKEDSNYEVLLLRTKRAVFPCLPFLQLPLGPLLKHTRSDEKASDKLEWKKMITDDLGIGLMAEGKYVLALRSRPAPTTPR